ncbi:MAG: ATP-grasp domain-containing protein [Cellvibrionaceae bacterium]|nr:ATP-grasp domain-containing protein [Cellvibrionaceae bacterium]
MKEIVCLVTGAGGGVGQGVIKCLLDIKDLNIKIIAADMSSSSAGLYLVPDRILVPAANDPDYISLLIQILKENDVDYYIPGTDVELKLCLKNTERIARESGTETLVVKGQAVTVGDDKYETARFLEKNGFEHPITHLFIARELPDSLKFPVILKPRVGCRSIGVSVARGAKDLEERLLEPDLVVQELVGSDDSEHTCTVVVHKGKVLGSLILKRELRAGDTYKAEPVYDESIDLYIRNVALALKVDGSVNFQLRVDASGTPKIFEINPRFSGTTPFCASLGFNPVEAYLKALLGIHYEYKVLYDHRILRCWEELLVPNDCM